MQVLNVEHLAAVSGLVLAVGLSLFYGKSDVALATVAALGTYLGARTMAVRQNGGT